MAHYRQPPAATAETRGPLAGYAGTGPDQPEVLPANEGGRHLLCADCYRAVLEWEPPEESAVREWRLRRRRV